MQAIPVPVKNVTLYPYLNASPGGPVVEPVIENATGTYSVGTLTTWIYYNLSLKGGEHITPLKLGAKYIASAELEDGRHIETHWMQCMKIGNEPTFGLSINMIHGHMMMGSPAPSSPEEDPYFVIAELDDLSAWIRLKPPAIGQVRILDGGKGQLIGTRFGTPHQTGVRITSGLRQPVTVGETLFHVTGCQAGNDRQVEFASLTAVIGGDQPVLLPHF